MLKLNPTSIRKLALILNVTIHDPSLKADQPESHELDKLGRNDLRKSASRADVPLLKRDGSPDRDAMFMRAIRRVHGFRPQQ